jgi:glycosyltransferase involved in cell wall biosynthesis
MQKRRNVMIDQSPARQLIPTMPSVSVILPTFNRTRFLKPAVESVYAQTYADWEIVIADDGSGEETKDYLRSIEGPKVRIIWLPHSGNPSQVRNAAIAAASGRYLAFLDSDDVWAPSKLEKQLAALRGRTNSRWSYTACDQIDENGRPIAKKRSRSIVRPEGWIFEELLTLQIGIAMPTVVAERNLVDEVGGFDEKQRFGEFHDLCLRLATKGEVVVVGEPLCSVRTHGEHYSSNGIADHDGWMRLYEKMETFTANPRLRAHCRKMRAETSLKLAREQGASRNSREAWRTLCRASAFSWRYPQWWWGVLKYAVRSSTPRALSSAFRRRRGALR